MYRLRGEAPRGRVADFTPTFGQTDELPKFRWGLGVWKGGDANESFFVLLFFYGRSRL